MLHHNITHIYSVHIGFSSLVSLSTLLTCPMSMCYLKSQLFGLSLEESISLTHLFVWDSATPRVPRWTDPWQIIAGPPMAFGERCLAFVLSCVAGKVWSLAIHGKAKDAHGKEYLKMHVKNVYEGILRRIDKAR